MLSFPPEKKVTSPLVRSPEMGGWEVGGGENHVRRLEASSDQNVDGSDMDCAWSFLYDSKFVLLVIGS